MEPLAYLGLLGNESILPDDSQPNLYSRVIVDKFRTRKSCI
jgi:hypothetical protein